MTVRAVILGLLSAIFIATVGYFNDQVPRLNHFVGNHFPIIVFGPLMLWAVLAAALKLGRGRRALRPAELAVIVGLSLVACNLPGSGMLRFFSRNVVMPVKFQRYTPGWQAAKRPADEGSAAERRIRGEGGILDYAPRRLLVNDGRYDEKTIRGFETGMAKEGQWISPAQVPWRMWRGPLAVWLPMVALVAVASICLGLMVHRNWSQRERLPYPVATLANTLIGADAESGGATVFRSRLFWIAAGIVLFIHVVNGLNVWITECLHRKSIEIPMSLDFSVFATHFPFLQRGRWVALWHISFYPTAIAFAYFVATDVSLAVGISPIALSLFTSVLLWSGGDITGTSAIGGQLYWQHAGSYFALALMVLYVGRRAYGAMFRGALVPGARTDAPAYEVWACRGFLACVAAVAVILASLGLDWPLAIMMVGMIMLTFLVMARMNAEAGLILVESIWQPTAVFLGLFGAKALGMEPLAIIGMIGVMFTLDSRESLLPFFINALRIGDLRKVSPARIGVAGGGVFAAAMVAAVAFGLWVDYNYGVRRGEGWATEGAPRKVFDAMIGYHNFMAKEGELKASDTMAPLSRFAQMKPDRNCLVWLAVGAGLVLAFYALRLRLPWWPIHPILFLFWGTWSMFEFAWSFLLGGFIKRLLTRFGAPRDKVRTFMIGVIAGDLMGGALWMIAGAIYYALTGISPPRYHVFPGG